MRPKLERSVNFDFCPKVKRNYALRYEDCFLGDIALWAEVLDKGRATAESQKDLEGPSETKEKT